MNKQQQEVLNKLMLRRVLQFNTPEEEEILNRCIEKYPYLKEILDAYPTPGSLIKEAFATQKRTNAAWDKFKKLDPGLAHIDLDKI